MKRTVDLNTARNMDKYYVLKAKAIPEVLLKVVEAKKLLESGAVASASEAAMQAGISRSTFYKYKDDIFRFDDHSRGKAITLSIEMKDEPGSLSEILKVVASHNANILTIHQSIPVSGKATVSLSIEIPTDTDEFVDALHRLTVVRGVNILAAE